MIKTIKDGVERLVRNETLSEKRAENSYSEMQYPRFLPLMHFHVEEYDIEQYGHLMVMHTETKMGMELLTCSFMPESGIALPYFLMDAMHMKKKQCVFVEYYDCGKKDLKDGKLREVYEIYRHLPDYPEKKNWYVGERTSYSLIKSGNTEELVQMAYDSVKAYLESIPDNRYDPSYLTLLEAFRERMIREGNPSSSVLEKLLKKEGAERFMKEAVMPLADHL